MAGNQIDFEIDQIIPHKKILSDVVKVLSEEPNNWQIEIENKFISIKRDTKFTILKKVYTKEYDLFRFAPFRVLLALGEINMKKKISD